MSQNIKKQMSKNPATLLGLPLSLLGALFSDLAMAQGQAQSPSPSQGFGMFLPLILIFVIFYFLIVRPQQKQAKKRQEMIKNLQKGDEVITVGGIHAKVVGVADNILTLEIAENTKIKVERSGVQALRSELTAASVKK